jgi:putative endonuclease
VGRGGVTPSAHQGLGAAGEALARRHLEGKGYHCLGTNWRCAAGELDLIMRDDVVLVFVEVKTRRGEGMGAAEEAVTAAKAGRLLRAATSYLMEHPDLGDILWRIDLVAVNLGPSGAVTRLTHLVNAIHSG